MPFGPFVAQRHRSTEKLIGRVETLIANNSCKLVPLHSSCKSGNCSVACV
jgi:hypothetical protein